MHLQMPSPLPEAHLESVYLICRVKRAELSDDEARESESLKKKKRRIKRPQSDSSEEEGKRG